MNELSSTMTWGEFAVLDLSTKVELMQRQGHK